MRIRLRHLAISAGMSLAAVCLSLPFSAQADEGHWRHREHYRHAPFDPALWATGMWIEGWYGGQYGWWWVNGGRRYYYERPVYPYPPMVSEVWYPETVVVQQPPVVVAPPPPLGAPPPPPPPPPPSQVTQPPPPATVSPSQQTWYYCDNPAGYFPYVQTCTTPFRAVPASPH